MSSRVGVGIAVAVLATLLIVAVLVMTGSPVAAPEPTRNASRSSPAVSLLPSGTPSATGSPLGTSVSATPLATPSDVCANGYLTGETPIVAPRKSGTFAEVALDAVGVGPGPFGTTARWRVRAFNPTGSPGTFELPLRATVRTSTGADLPILGYETGPPNAEAARATETVAIDPCNPAAVPGTRQRGKAVLVVHTVPITSGSYVLTLRELKLPEGGTREEVWDVALTCALDGGPAGGLDCKRS